VSLAFTGLALAPLLLLLLGAGVLQINFKVGRRAGLPPACWLPIRSGACSQACLAQQLPQAALQQWGAAAQGWAAHTARSGQARPGPRMRRPARAS
jgi:hypothetical protein